MAPRTRRLAAQERRDKALKSLRSVFPLEVVNEVLSYLDQASLASFCRVSYHSLEEAGPQLMKHVDITSWEAFEAFFLQPSSLVSSRLHSHLQTTHMRTSAVRLRSVAHPRSAETIASTVQRRVFPPAHPLLRLAVTYPGVKCIQLLFEKLLPSINPIHLEFLAHPDRQVSSSHYGWVSALSPLVFTRWTALRRITCLGWLPFGPKDSLSTFFLTCLLPSGEPVDLELDLRGWGVTDISRLLQVLALSNALKLPRFRMLRWSVSEGWQEALVRDEVAKMTEAEQDKIELVVVE